MAQQNVANVTITMVIIFMAMWKLTWTVCSLFLLLGNVKNINWLVWNKQTLYVFFCGYNILVLWGLVQL